MNKKVFSLVMACTLLLTVLSSCKSPEPETATQNSDGESLTISNTINDTEEKISKAEQATPAINFEKFTELLANPDLNAVAYEGTEDFILAKEERVDKAIITDTHARVEISSPLYELIVLNAGELTVKAPTDSIIIKGDGVNASVNADVKSMYIIGKDTKLHIYDGNVSGILIRNTTTVIYNHSDNDAGVILTNGTKVTVPKNHTYKASDNTLTKGILDQ